MKKYVWAGALLLSGLLAGVAISQPEGGMPKMDKKSIAAMLAQKGQPVEEHKILDALVGESDVETRLMLGPGMPPLVVKSTMKSEWVLGKRFICAKSAPAADEELKIESISYWGYDKRSKKYFWLGIDSMDTYSVFAQGDYDKEKKTLTVVGENEEEGMGKVPFKNVLDLSKDDSRTMTLWMQFKGAPGADADGWFKVVEMIITKKKI